MLGGFRGRGRLHGRGLAGRLAGPAACLNIFLCLGSLVTVLWFYGWMPLFTRPGTTFDLQFMAAASWPAACRPLSTGWLPLYLPELFPTRVRATGQGFGFNFGRILAAIGVLQVPCADGQPARLRPGLLNAGCHLPGRPVRHLAGPGDARPAVAGVATAELTDANCPACPVLASWRFVALLFLSRCLFFRLFLEIFRKACPVSSPFFNSLERGISDFVPEGLRTARCRRRQPQSRSGANFPEACPTCLDCPARGLADVARGTHLLSGSHHHGSSQERTVSSSPEVIDPPLPGS